MTFWSCSFRDAWRCPAWQPAGASCHLATAGSHQDSLFAYGAAANHGPTSVPALLHITPGGQERQGCQARAVTLRAELDAVASRLLQRAWNAGVANMALRPAWAAAGANGGEPGDFLARYRQVSNKLKRFLRKPNVAEGRRAVRPAGRAALKVPAVTRPGASWRWRAASRRSSTGASAGVDRSCAPLSAAGARRASAWTATPPPGKALQAAAAALGAAMRLHLGSGSRPRPPPSLPRLAAALRDLGQPAARAATSARCAARCPRGP